MIKNNNITMNTPREQTSLEKALSSYPDILTTKDLKEILHIRNNKVYELLKSGTIPSFKLDSNSRPHYIVKSDLIDYIENRMTVKN